MKPPPKKTAISLQKDNQLFSVETFQCENFSVFHVSSSSPNFLQPA